MSYPPEVLAEAGVDPNEFVGHAFSRGAGCDRCNDTGYRGRTAIHEIFEMDRELRKMVIRVESNIRIKQRAVERGMRTLRQDGWEKVLLGLTTLEEVMRITALD
jgi:type IV pilus assembly protein PilB